MSVTALLAHLSHIHRGPIVDATELLTPVSHMRQVPVVGATELSTGIPQMHYSSLVGARQRLTSPISTPSIFNWISWDTLRMYRIWISLKS